MGTKLQRDEESVSKHQNKNNEILVSLFWKRSLAAILVLCLIVWQLLRYRTPLASDERYCHGPFEGRIQYKNESILWKSCGDVSGHPVECSNVTVPVDQFDKENLKNITFSIPLIRMRGEDATQNLLLNPGGPGSSGVEFLLLQGKQLRDIVGDGFHLLSFDPRGINGSLPLASCYPDKETHTLHPDPPSFELIHDSPKVYASAQNFVKACAATMGEYGGYINTPQTAADMNSILDAIGQDDMVFWGFSYGTILGQTYATMFPERSRRIIIDGVANNFARYGEFIDMEQFADTEKVLNGFFDECIKAGKNCSLSSLGNSGEQLRELVVTFSAELKRQPISVFVNSTTYGLLEYSDLWYNGIFPCLYEPSSWYSLARNLADLLRGNATEAWLAYGRKPAWNMRGQARQFVTYNDGLSGAKYWPQDRLALQNELRRKLNGSLFGPTDIREYYERAQWRVPRTHNFTQIRGVKTAHPLLIISTTYDPICPMASAKSAQAAFLGSQIVEVKGYGHCSFAVGSTCLAKRVREFLYDGRVPHNFSRCEIDAPYFVEPSVSGGVVPFKSFQDPEEAKIHLAQLKLARDWQWKHLPVR